MIETAWLIEFGFSAQPQYFGRTIEGFGMTAEHLDAIRFSRKADAEAAIEFMSQPDAKAIEHQWNDGKPDPLTPTPYDREAGRILRGHTKIGCLCRYCKNVLNGAIVLNEE